MGCVLSLTDCRVNWLVKELCICGIDGPQTMLAELSWGKESNFFYHLWSHRSWYPLLRFHTQPKTKTSTTMEEKKSGNTCMYGPSSQFASNVTLYPTWYLSASAQSDPYSVLVYEDLPLTKNEHLEDIKIVSLEDLPNPVQQALDNYSPEYIQASKHRRGPRIPQPKPTSQAFRKFQMITSEPDTDCSIQLCTEYVGGVCMMELDVSVSGSCWYFECSCSVPSKFAIGWMVSGSFKPIDHRRFTFDGAVCGQLDGAYANHLSGIPFYAVPFHSDTLGTQIDLDFGEASFFCDGNKSFSKSLPKGSTYVPVVLTCGGVSLVSLILWNNCCCLSCSEDSLMSCTDDLFSSVKASSDIWFQETSKLFRQVLWFRASTISAFPLSPI